jgi:integrase
VSCRGRRDLEEGRRAPARPQPVTKDAEDGALESRSLPAEPSLLPAATPAAAAVPELEPVPIQTPTALVALDQSRSLDHESASRLMAAFLAGRNANTLRAYRRDLEAFAAHAHADTVDAAAARLLAGGLGPANAAALGWRAAMLDQGLASSTVNRRLAALRSLVRVGRLLGIVAWKLEVEGLRDEPYRDTRGPGVAGVQALMDQVAKRDDAKGRRDAAILRLAYDLGLRRGEIVGLDPEHLDLAAPTVLVWARGGAAGRS